MRTVLIFVLVLVLDCRAETVKAPVSFRYVQTGQFNNKGRISFGTTFWATNHTSERVAMNIYSIEVKKGTNWVTASQQIQPLWFDQPGKPKSEHVLGPHSAGYATTKVPSQPAETTWRVKVSVQAVLTGLADKATRIKRSPDLWQRRIQTGNTNLPMNPFATNMTFYGKVTEVMSQEITEE